MQAMGHAHGGGGSGSAAPRPPAAAQPPAPAQAVPPDASSAAHPAGLQEVVPQSADVNVVETLEGTAGSPPTRPAGLPAAAAHPSCVDARTRLGPQARQMHFLWGLRVHWLALWSLQYLFGWQAATGKLCCGPWREGLANLDSEYMLATASCGGRGRPYSRCAGRRGSSARLGSGQGTSRSTQGPCWLTLCMMNAVAWQQEPLRQQAACSHTCCMRALRRRQRRRPLQSSCSATTMSRPSPRWRPLRRRSWCSATTRSRPMTVRRPWRPCARCSARSSSEV